MMRELWEDMKTDKGGYILITGYFVLFGIIMQLL